MLVNLKVANNGWKEQREWYTTNRKFSFYIERLRLRVRGVVIAATAPS